MVSGIFSAEVVKIKKYRPGEQFCIDPVTD